MLNFPGFFPALLTYFFQLQRFACGSTTDKRHIYFWLIGQRLSHLFVVAEFSVQASISQLGDVGPIYLLNRKTESREWCHLIIFLFNLCRFVSCYFIFLYWIWKGKKIKRFYCFTFGIFQEKNSLMPRYEVILIPQITFEVILLLCINIGTGLIPEHFRPFPCNYLPLTLFWKSWGELPPAPPVHFGALS